MSDDNKQLTVAELLARANRDTGEEAPRRRRRRSLEEGGISVAELTGSIPAVKEKPAEARHSSVPIDEPEAPVAPAPKPDEPETPAAPTPATDETAVLEKVTVEAEPELEPEPEIAVEEPAVEEKTSITGVILMALIGVVLGVVVFKGFEMLWENLSRPIVAGLAILVTVGIVGVVKALRTANDGLSMFLAALVGIVMTFGPLAVVLL
ncbi:hypothetical protein [Corynebacterium nasicanis]|uniref:Uncharacterized protein n=1 Tax=Corynebacterium nasicanis TaxID=1448267 RepID=A0ABW1QFK4_9CORY